MGDEVVKILNALCEKFGIAIDWSSQNVVPYIQLLSKRCVNYEIGTSIMWLFLGIVMLGASYWLFKNVCSKKDAPDFLYKSDWNDLQIVSWVATILLAGFGIFAIIQEAYDLITCFTFPEKIVFNQITEIYKSLK